MNNYYDNLQCLIVLLKLVIYDIVLFLTLVMTWWWCEIEHYNATIANRMNWTSFSHYCCLLRLFVPILVLLPCYIPPTYPSCYCIQRIYPYRGRTGNSMSISTFV